MIRRPRHARRKLGAALRNLPPPCCPDRVPFDGAYLHAQGAHQRAQADDPEHDNAASVCCCWDCRGWRGVTAGAGR